MANNNVIGKFSDEIEQAVGEVASDVKDSVGEMIEQNIQTTFGPKLTPQQIQQQQQTKQEEDARLAKARGVIASFNQNLSQAQAKVRQENQQKEAQRLQAFDEEMKKKSTKQMTVHTRKAKMGLPEEIARSRQETGKGRGVGG